MKLAEAMRALQQRPSGMPETLDVQLVCGFTPAHIEIFVAAHLLQRLPAHDVRIHTPDYGDLLAALHQHSSVSFDAVLVLVEWADLDPRLGYRRTGGWAPKQLEDIASTVETQAQRITDRALERAAVSNLVVCWPSLPLPPADHVLTSQASTFFWRLDACFSRESLRLCGHSNCRVLNPHALAYQSPLAQRLDMKGLLTADLPYELAHASAVAELASALLTPPTPKKGLITDLDGTLWDGILGEDGINGVSWTLEQNTHIHAVYQQLLSSFADAGVLIAVASKNDPVLVEQAFQRQDLLLRPDQIFPREVHWGEKSESVGRILEKWNIAADAVVFVDDTPLELAEVANRYPDVNCLRFPKGDDGTAHQFFLQLRDLFARELITAEDALRLDSLRRSQHVTQAVSAGASTEQFLQGLDSVVDIRRIDSQTERRAFELINKTNQFNLNGRRCAQSQWRELLADQTRISLVVSYTDKFGPLGNIAVISGCLRGTLLTIDIWVMSCRAFSRRIEYRSLQQLFQHTGADTIKFSYERTERNAPLRSFLETSLGAALSRTVIIPKTQFDATSPPLYGTVSWRIELHERARVTS